MKRTVRLNESQLHRVINEAVKRVLRESVDNKNHQMVEEFLQKMGVDTSSINWASDNYFEMENDGSNGSVFQNEEEAYHSVVDKSGDDHRNAIDYVRDAMDDEEWVDYLIHGGVKPNIAKSIIQNEDWEMVVKIIANKCGPEWFLSTYSGQVYGLPDGSLLYY